MTTRQLVTALIICVALAAASGVLAVTFAIISDTTGGH